MSLMATLFFGTERRLSKGFLLKQEPYQLKQAFTSSPFLTFLQAANNVQVRKYVCVELTGSLTGIH